MKTDLTSPELQSLFKKNQRIFTATYVLMGCIAVVNGGLAIWAATTKSRTYGISWSEILFIVLIGVILACCIAVLIWKLKTHKKYAAALYGFVAENMLENGRLLTGSNVTLIMLLAADKLTVINRDNEEAVQMDLSPVKSFTSVCAGVVNGVKKFCSAYFVVKANGGEVDNATLINAVGKKQKEIALVVGGSPTQDVKNNYFIKNGLVK